MSRRVPGDPPFFTSALKPSWPSFKIFISHQALKVKCALCANVIGCRGPGNRGLLRYNIAPTQAVLTIRSRDCCSDSPEVPRRLKVRNSFSINPANVLTVTSLATLFVIVTFALQQYDQRHVRISGPDAQSAFKAQMLIDELKPNIIVRGPIFPEPVQVIVAIPMGTSVKLVGKGLKRIRFTNRS